MTARRSTSACLYPDEAEIARRVLGDRAAEWPAKAVIFEREGLPKIDPHMGGRYWPAVKLFFNRRHGLDRAEPGFTMSTNPRVRFAEFVPDGPENTHAEETRPADRRWHSGRARRARA